MAEHALLSPSGASRWLACPPSARLEQLFNDNAGQAAQEGTLAHAVSEALTKRRLERLNLKQFNELIAQYKEHELYNAEMYDLCDEYSAYIMERFHDAQTRSKDAMIFLETRIDLTRWIPEGFGTGDVFIIADGLLEFIDLKYGKGVKVHAARNKQLMTYALGALDIFSMLYDITDVRMTIYQPRIDHIDSFDMPVAELLEWGETILRPIAAQAFKGEGAYNPGEHCRFCRAKNQCRANAEYQMEVAKFDFRQADLLTDAEIAEIYGRYDSLTNWIKSVTAWALQEALKGREFPGLKLVEGRGKRSWLDEAAIADVLRSHDYKNEDIYQPAKLKGLTDMTKLIGKRDFAKWLTEGGHIKDPKGAPSLAPLSDPRPVFTPSATDDFADFKDPDDESA